MRPFVPGLVVSLAFAAATGTGSAGDEIIIRPSPGPGPLANPLKGWCPYTDAGPIRRPYSMVYVYVSWKELEPGEGRYAFEAWERRAWSAPEAGGKHVVLRPYVDYPGKPSGLPEWLRGKVKETRYEEHGGGLSPDYDDPSLVAGLERLVAAMGRRYDGNPRVAFLELGLLGFWGEWHTWPRGALYASPATERKVVEAYRRAFPHKILMAREARGFVGEQPWVGFHDDLFPEDTDNGREWSFLAKIRASGRSGNWERAAVGGEMAPGRARQWLGDGFGQTLDMLGRAHFTWVGPYGPALDRSTDPVFLERCDALVRRMGYQFRLTEIRHPSPVARGSPLAVTVRGENVGVAPFYYPWPVTLALLDPSGSVAARAPAGCDVRSWLPGPFAFEGRLAADVPPGRYGLALGVIDPWTGLPAVRFANDLPERGGWAVVSGVVVVGG